MAVHAISQGHLSQPEKPTTQTHSRTNNGPGKTNAHPSAPQNAQSNGAQPTRAVAAAENHAGQEQDARQHEEPETKGTRVNTYA